MGRSHFTVGFLWLGLMALLGGILGMTAVASLPLGAQPRAIKESGAVLALGGPRAGQVITLIPFMRAPGDWGGVIPHGQVVEMPLIVGESFEIEAGLVGRQSWWSGPLMRIEAEDEPLDHPYVHVEPVVRKLGHLTSVVRIVVTGKVAGETMLRASRVDGRYVRFHVKVRG